MSQNTTALMNQTITPVYVGLDIAKASLQLDLQAKSYDLANTPSGHAQLVKRLAAVPGAHVLCEATGGYERAVVAALHAAAIPVSVLNPARARQSLVRAWKAKWLVTRVCCSTQKLPLQGEGRRRGRDRSALGPVSPQPSQIRPRFGVPNSNRCQSDV